MSVRTPKRHRAIADIIADRMAVQINELQAEVERLKSLLQKVSDGGSEYAADGYAEVHISHALRQDIKNELAGG